MTTSLGLRLVQHGAAGEQHKAALEAAVGTVPAKFHLTDSADDPHVAWVFGGEGWAQQVEAALQAGALAVVLDAAGPFDPSELEAFQHRPVVLAGTRTHAPQVRELASRLPALGDPAFVEVLVVDDTPEAAFPAVLWDIVATLTAAGLHIDSVPRVTVGEQALMAETTIGTARVHLSHVRRHGAVPRASIKVFSAQGSVEATMGDPTVALPGRVLGVGATDASLSSTAYVTPRRVALEEVHATVARGLNPPGLLELHAHAASLLSQVSWAGGEQRTPTQLEGTNR